MRLTTSPSTSSPIVASWLGEDLELGVPLVSADEALSSYDAAVLW